MTKRQIDREYEKIDYELRINNPPVSPYPPDIVKRRELLLYAQVHLANIFDAKRRRDNIMTSFEEFQYWCVMDDYYNWDKTQLNT
ncbi:MAG: hypothetical protein A2073_07565 [Deltaproteobacteria bacterium GWC2_42_11]|nr:MAG: hypothetical protein A2073_07565 [Deltaproteobacteria bacterium GWC2_42_11]HBO84200.1 hypothetical protein [Deltaproteobacteria bacterium]